MGHFNYFAKQILCSSKNFSGKTILLEIWKIANVHGEQTNIEILWLKYLIELLL